MIDKAGEIDGAPVAQVAAIGQVHAQDRIARPAQGQLHRHVGLGAAVRLDIGIGAAEDLFGPLDSNLFDHIHEFTTAVVAVPGIALGILVGQGGSHGGHHRNAGKIL